MGFDLHGVKPKTETGEYFRNNVWWWRPLWDYVYSVCSDILTDEERHKGCYNDGYEIQADKAKEICRVLSIELESGRTREYAMQYDIDKALLPKQKCRLCEGTGMRNDEIGKRAREARPDYKCNGCQGEGQTPPFESHYHFSVENVRGFMLFCKDSGGFDIC